MCSQFLPCRAALQAQLLWVSSLMKAANKGDELVIKRQARQKKKRFESWDLAALGRLVETRAITLGRLQVVDTLLILSASKPMVCAPSNTVGASSWIRPHTIFAKSSDARVCALCCITGDCVVQGRLLFVELGVWAHVNCMCWSYGVFEDTRRKKMGKCGMLCNVHKVIREAGAILCDFCGCPGASVCCSAPGCTAASHFGCAHMLEFLFFPENVIFCQGCKDHPLIESVGGISNAMPHWQLAKTSARHLRVMSRPMPKPAHDKKSNVKSPGHSLPLSGSSAELLVLDLRMKLLRKKKMRLSSSSRMMAPTCMRTFCDLIWPHPRTLTCVVENSCNGKTMTSLT